MWLSFIPIARPTIAARARSGCLPISCFVGGGVASGGHFRPAPDVEFKYYLIKQVLKRTLTETQWAKTRQAL